VDEIKREAHLCVFSLNLQKKQARNQFQTELQACYTFYRNSIKIFHL